MKKRFSEQQILNILKDGESGLSADEVSRRHGIHVNTYYKWHSKYAGMDLSDAKRLKHLEDENRRLKRIVADQALDITMLKDINSKNW